MWISESQTANSSKTEWKKLRVRTTCVILIVFMLSYLSVPSVILAVLFVFLREVSAVMKKGCFKIIFCLALSMLLAVHAGGVAFSADSSSFSASPPDSGVSIVDPLAKDSSFSAVLYNNTNGLPTSSANDIAETSDGFIWIGCYSGLVRYDGNHFEQIDSSTGIANVACLYVDSRDRLWIGTNDSGLAMFDNGVLTLWNEADGLKSSKVNAIAEDRTGLIYAGTTAGIVTIDADLALHSFDDPRVDDIYVEMFRTAANGRIYGISNNDDVFTIQDGEVDGYLSHTKNRIREVVCIFPDPKSPGYVYLGTGNSELYYGDLSGNFDAHDQVDLSPLSEVKDIRQFEDRLWITARNGIGVLDGSDLSILNDLPMNNSICHVMADYEGNLWFTSTRQGVMKIVPNRFSNISERYGLPDAVINTTCVYGDWLLIGSDDGLIVLDEEKGVVSAIPLDSAVTASGNKIDANDLISYFTDAGSAPSSATAKTVSGFPLIVPAVWCATITGTSSALRKRTASLPTMSVPSVNVRMDRCWSSIPVACASLKRIR